MFNPFIVLILLHFTFPWLHKIKTIVEVFQPAWKKREDNANILTYHQLRFRSFHIVFMKVQVLEACKMGKVQ